MYIGIDLALRKIGITVLDDNGKMIDFVLFDSDSKKYNNEELLIYNETRVFETIGQFYWADDPDGPIEGKINNITIGLEGLSFNSPSPSVDLIAANHWMVRCNTYLNHPEAKINIIPPKSWQKYILTKEVLEPWSKQYPVVRAKKGMKLTAEQTKSNTKNKAEIKKLAKQYIYEQIPQDIRTSIEEYLIANKLPKDGKYDISDSYWLAKYVYDRNK